MSKVMEYKQIMILISIVFFSCESKKISNDYIFPETNSKWFFIVDNCKESQDFEVNGKRIFNFQESNFLLGNMIDFEVSASDSFYIDEEVFDPDSKEIGQFKLCYFLGAKNVGYSNRQNNGTATEENFNIYFF